MAVNDILHQLQSLIQGSAPRLIEVTDQPKDVIPFLPGERYTAKVQEEITNGRFLVLIRDQKLDLNLPRNTQPGQNIELRFISAEPRLTFVLAEEVAHVPTQAAVKLSDGARYLGALLDRVKTLATSQSQAQSPALTTQVQQTAKPLFAAAPPPLAQFVALLKESVTQSGLFYESHQAQWAAGEKPLADLLREPQGKLSEPRAFATAQAAASMPGFNQLPKLEMANLLAASSTFTPQENSHDAVHPQTVPLVQQQVDALDMRQMVWQGQVWAGQDMRWQIEERAARDGEADAAREWQTRLDLQLPKLGEVNAVLKISPQGAISIALTARTGETTRALQAASPLLNQSMERAGLQLITLNVETDGSS
jgi:hypothetical protein